MKELLPRSFGLVVRCLAVSAILVAAATPVQAQPLSTNVGPSLGPSSVGEFQYGLVATGGTGGYSWDISAGALPPGLALRTDNLPSWFPPGSTAGLVGILTTPGTYNFTVRVTSGVEEFEQATTLRVTTFRSTAPNPMPDGFVGTAYSVALTSDGAAGAVTWTATGALPAGLTLDGGGLLSGTPTAEGFHNIQYSVTDGTDTLYLGTSINVHRVNITSAVLPNATTGQAYGPVSVAAAGGVAPYTFSSFGGLPFGLSMDAAGVISGTTTTGPGRYNFSVTVIDSAAGTFSKQLTIMVLGVPKQLPSISPYGGRFDDCTIGVQCTLGVSVTGTAPFEWSATGLPAGLSMALSGSIATWIQPGDGEITGTPTVAGNFSVTVTVTDADGMEASNTFPLHVSTLAQRTDQFNGMLGIAMNVPLRFIGGTGAYTVALVGGRLPEGVTFNPATLRLTGTPIENSFFNPVFHVIDSGGATLTASFSFGVFGPGINISHNGDLGSYSAGSFFSQQLFACCASGYSWSVARGPLAPGLSLTAGGQLSGTLASAGQYTFVIEVADTELSSNRAAIQFQLSVSSLWVSNNWALGNGFVGTPYSTPLTTSGASGTVTFTLEPHNYLPPGLALTSSAGAWSLTGTPLSSGLFWFRVRATDTSGQIAFANLSIPVYPAGFTPPIGLSQGPNFGTMSIGQIETQLVATGGAGTFAWSLTAGALPTGLALRTPPELAPWFSPDATAGLSGIATVPGNYNFTLHVASGSEVVDQAATMRVSGMHSADQYSLPDAFVNQFFTHQLAIAGNAGPVTFTPNGPMPQGLTLGPGGVLSGTPTASGFFAIGFNVSDGVDTVYVNRSLSIFDLRITTAGELPNATQGVPYGPVTIAAVGGTLPHAFTVTSLPFGLFLDPITGVITGTPTTGPGRYGFTMTVTDAAHISYSKTMAIDVLGVPPSLPSVSINGNDWDDCTFAIPCNRYVYVGSGTAPFTWTATDLPQGLTFRFGSANTDRWVTPGDLEIIGVPTALGTFPITVTVTDALGASASNTFDLTISRMMLQDFFGNGIRGEAYDDRLRVIGGVPPYTAAFLSGTLPVGLSFDSSALRVTGIPLENGFYSFVLGVTDSVGNTLRTSIGLSIGGGTTTINVNGPTLPTAFIGQNYSTSLSACCLPTNVYTWSFEDGPHAGWQLSPSGQLTSVGPVAGPPGPVSFLVRGTDSANPLNFGVRLLTLTVTSLSITSSFTLPYGNVGAVYSQALAASGGSGALTWELSPYNHLPPGLSLSAAGVLGGTPSATGQFFFSVTAYDGSGNTATRGFNLSIYPAGEYPPLSLNIGTNFNASLGVYTLSIGSTAASGGLAPYTYSLTPEAELPPGAAQVPGMRIANGPPYPSGFASSTPAVYMGVIAAPGVYHPSIRVTDSLGTQFDRVIALTVPALTFLSQNNLPKATRNAVASYSFTPEVYGGSGNYIWTATGLPAGFSIDSATGQITGNTSVTSLTVFPNITVTDLTASATANRTFTLAIDPFAILTNGVLPQGTAGAPYSMTFSAPDCGSGCSWTSLGSMPSGLSLTSAGVLSGTPNGSFTGTLSVRVNGSNGSVQKVFSLVILNAAFPALTATGPSSLNEITVGQSSSTMLTATGGAPSYTWSLEGGALPPGISIVNDGQDASSDFAPGIGYLSGRGLVPGAYAFTLRATDSVGAFTTKAYTLNVSRLSFQYSNLPLSPSSGPPLVYNQGYSQPLLVLGGTGTYPSWTNLTALPPGLFLDGASGLVSGTPTNTGIFGGVQIRVFDAGGNSITGNVSFTIAGPTSTFLTLGGPNLGTVVQGSGVSISMNPSGGTPPYTVTALTALPPGLELLSSAQGVLGGPSSGFALSGIPLQGGVFTFTIHAQDSVGNIGVRTFTLAVAPFVTFTNQTLPDGSVGTPYSVPLTAFSNGGTPAWSVAAGSLLPPGLVLDSNGLLSGTPDAAGNFNLVLTVGDGSGITVNRTFSLRVSTITIEGAAILPHATTGTSYSHTFTSSGGTGAILWSNAGSLPGGLTLSAATGELSGTPTGRGTFSLTITATDGASTVTRRFMLPAYPPIPTVLDIPAETTALGYLTLGQNTSLTLSVNSGKPPYTWSVPAGSMLPPGLTLLTGAALTNFAPGSAVIAGMPTTEGTYTFDLVVTDTVGTQARRTYTVTVSALGVLVGNGPATSVNTTYTVQLAAVGGTAPYTFTMRPESYEQDMLPPGFTLSPSGLLSGTTTSTGLYTFILHVVDNTGRIYERSITFTVNGTGGLRINNFNPSDSWIGSGRRITLNTNGAPGSTYTWSVVGGSLPPGMALVTGTPTATATSLAGAPAASGIYTYTLRATDNVSGAFAEHRFTYRIGAVQIVTPPIELLNILDAPSAQVGVAYSFTFRAAGGAPPYTFAQSAFDPLPAGLTLSSNGTLSGTPAPGSIGLYAAYPVVTDTNGDTVNTFPFNLFVTPAGIPAPLTRISGGLYQPSVGVPYAYGLDLMMRGGTRPFAWSVDGALPPGMALVTDGTSTYLGGTPTTAGLYTFSLVVTDAGAPAQSVTMPFTVRVSTLGMTPDALPPGMVGAVYAQALVSTGGTGPYTVQRGSNSGLPPGLTFSGNTLSGTPTSAGNFVVVFIVTDAGGNQLTRPYAVTIDNAGGEAPAVTLAPRPVQLYHEQGSPNPAPIPLSIASTSGNVPFTMSLAGIAGASLSTSAGTTPGTVNLTVDQGALGVGTHTGVVAVDAPGSANLWQFVPVTVTIAPAPPCTYAVNPVSSSMAETAGTGSVSVAAGPTCSWTASSSDAWLTVTSGSSGTGNGGVTFSATSNGAPTSRSATVTVTGATGNVTHTVTQFGTACSFAISPQVLSATSTGGSAAVNVIASSAACAWTAASTDMGVSPAGGTGNGSVTVLVPPNGAAASHVLAATIAGHLFTVNQSGIDCTVSLSPYSASAPAAGTTGSVDVTTQADCSYNTALGPSWLTVTSGGSGVGPGTLVYSVDANSTTFPRTGTLTIGGQAFQVTQDPLACSVTISTSGLGSPYGSSAATGTIGITANGSNCTWAASSDVSWATPTGLSGTGNGTLGVAVSSNAASTTSRDGTLTVAGQTVNISQAGTSCSYALESATGAAPASGGNGSVRVIAPSVCGWSSSSNAPWLTITSSGSAGTSEVQFSAGANGSASPRSGTLTIAGLTYAVTQAGAACTYTITGPTTSPLLAAEGAPGQTFAFTSSFTGCAPAAVSYASWLTVDLTSFAGTSGTVTYSAAPNPFGLARSGTLQVGNATYTAVQSGAACSYSLNAYGRIFHVDGGSNAVLGSPTALACTPVVGTDQPSFITLEPLTGPVSSIFTLPYSVAPFPASLNTIVRFGTIAFGGQIVVIKQYSW